jgi:hypothetical protein
MLYVLRGWINAQWRGTRERLQPCRLCLYRSARLSSLTHRGYQFESNFELLPLPPVCSQSAVEIGVI